MGRSKPVFSSPMFPLVPSLLLHAEEREGACACESRPITASHAEEMVRLVAPLPVVVLNEQRPFFTSILVNGKPTQHQQAGLAGNQVKLSAGLADPHSLLHGYQFKRVHMRTVNQYRAHCMEAIQSYGLSLLHSKEEDKSHTR